MKSASASGARRERDDAPRAPIAAEAAEPAGRAEEQAAADPVDGDRVEHAAEEGPDRDQRLGERRVVEERGARRASRARRRSRRARSIAVSGSCRASTASSDSSRSETKTARGATSTAGARSHQLRASAESRAVSAVAAMTVRLARRRSVQRDRGEHREEDDPERHESARDPGPGAQLRAPLRVRSRSPSGSSAAISAISGKNSVARTAPATADAVVGGLGRSGRGGACLHGASLTPSRRRDKCPFRTCPRRPRPRARAARSGGSGRSSSPRPARRPRASRRR